MLEQRNKIGQWEAKITEWDQPEAFEDNLTQFQGEFVGPMIALLGRMSDGSGSLGKVAIINMLKEGVDVFDRSIKAISGSPTLSGSQKL